MTSSDPKLDFVVPCYNPPAGFEGNLLERFASVAAQLEAQGWRSRLLLADDGSTRAEELEKGAARLRTALGDRFILLRLKHRGKGGAVRQGVSAAEASTLVLTDVDFPYSEEVVLAAIARHRSTGADLVVGQRPLDYYRAIPFQRRLISLAFRWVIRLVFRLGVNDTQCGIKVLGPRAQALVRRLRTDSFLYDLELLLLAKRARLSIESVPAVPRPGFSQSNVRWRVLVSELLALLRLLAPARGRGWVPAIGALALATLVTGLARALLDPRGVFFSGVGDGLKNYFTVVYQVLHGDSALWFRGMNFPFGEHLVYADGQPLLTWLLSPLAELGLGAGALVATMNWQLALEAALSGAVLAGVLRRLGLSRAYAAATGFAVALGSPQLLRWTGHYALGHFLPIPLLLWLHARALPGRAGGPRGRLSLARWRAPAIALHGLAWGLVHPYFLPLLGLLSAGLETGLALLARPAPLAVPPKGRAGGAAARVAGWAARVATQSALPVAAFLAVMAATDPMTDRSVASWVYKSSFTGVFVLRWHELLGWLGSPLRHRFLLPGFEGLAGVSLTGLPLLLPTLWALGILAARRRRLAPADAFAVSVLLAGCAALAVSFGALPRIEAFRQFRSVGRFAWVFYYAYGIAAAVGVARAARLLQFRRAARGRPRPSALAWAPGAFAAFTLLESLAWVTGQARGMRDAFAPLPQASLLPAGVAAADYRAVLALPYYHVGAGPGIEVWPREPALQASQLVSLQTGLPLIDSHLSRASVGQAQAMLAFGRGGQGPGAFVRELVGGPVLVLAPRGAGLTEGERSLIRLAAPLGERAGIEFYRLAPPPAPGPR